MYRLIGRFLPPWMVYLTSQRVGEMNGYRWDFCTFLAPLISTETHAAHTLDGIILSKFITVEPQSDDLKQTVGVQITGAHCKSKSHEDEMGPLYITLRNMTQRNRFK